MEVRITINNKKITLILTPAQEGGYVVTSPDLKGLVTQGDTKEEAITNGYDAADILLYD